VDIGTKIAYNVKYCEGQKFAVFVTMVNSCWCALSQILNHNSWIRTKL